MTSAVLKMFQPCETPGAPDEIGCGGVFQLVRFLSSFFRLVVNLSRTSPSSSRLSRADEIVGGGVEASASARVGRPPTVPS